MKKTTVFSIFGVINSQVVKEADELIADELVEMNRHAKFCYTTTEIAKRYGMKGNDLLSFLRDRHPLQPAGQTTAETFDGVDGKGSRVY